MPDPHPKYKGDLLHERRAGAPTALRDVFFHHRVLRSGWGLLLFAATFALCVNVESIVIDRYHRRTGMATWYLQPTDILNPLIALIAVLIATVTPSFFEHRYASTYGLRGTPWKPLAIGLATGAALVIAGETGLHLAGALITAAPSTPLLLALRHLVLWTGIFLLFALLEELLTRGYLQYTLTRLFAFLYRRFLGLDNGVPAGFWTAALVTSALFAWLYKDNAGQTQLGLACLFTMGLLYCWSIWRTGSLWWAIGFHLAWDMAQAYLFMQWSGGLPIRDHVFAWVAADPLLLSGGHAGLNGSAIAYLLLAIAFASLLLLKKTHPYPELWAQAELEARQAAHARTLPDPGRA